MFKSLFLALFFALLPAVLSAPAQANFGVGPIEVALQAPRAGARLTSQFELFNNSDESIFISAYTNDWQMDRGGNLQIADAGTTAASCAKWIEINPSQFILEPRKVVKVRYSIQTPADLKEEHHALVFFQSRPVPVEGANQMKFSVSSRVGCKVFVLPTQTLTTAGKISAFVLDEQPEAWNSNVMATFINTGAMSVRLSGTVEARDAKGIVIGKGKLMPNNVQVLPGGVQDLRPAWEMPLPSGDYSFRATLDYGGKQILGAETKGVTTQILGLAPPTPAIEAPAPEVEDAKPAPSDDSIGTNKADQNSSAIPNDEKEAPKVEAQP